MDKRLFELFVGLVSKVSAAALSLLAGPRPAASLLRRGQESGGASSRAPEVLSALILWSPAEGVVRRMARSNLASR